MTSASGHNVSDNEHVQEAFQQAMANLQRGNLPVAESLLRPLTHLAPERSNVWQLLGVVRAQQGDMDEAETLLQRAIELAPDSAGAHHNLGNVLALMLRNTDAVQALSRSLELDPENPSALVTRGQVYMALGRPVDALNSLDAALVLDPTSSPALIARADAMRPLSDLGLVTREAAVAAYQVALEAGADPDNVRYCLAAMGEAEAPDSAPAQFVTALFDTYAEAFDQHLLETLAYRTPMQIGEALQHVDQGTVDQVLDLGCGTGLCGPLLRPLARQLTGLDLSPKMLDKARERGFYDDLVCAEMLGHLQACLPASLDLVVAADVFVYVGDLQPVFAAVAQALQPAGRFVFSIETLDASRPNEAAVTTGYLLRHTRRYAHDRRHLEALGAALALQTEHTQEVVLRKDADKDVAGAVMVLRRT